MLLALGMPSDDGHQSIPLCASVEKSYQARAQKYVTEGWESIKTEKMGHNYKVRLCGSSG